MPALHSEIEKLPAHMRDFGLHLLGKAVRDSCFSEMGAPYAHAMALTIAAQATEILIKARIAEEHPLLIFSKLPRIDKQGALEQLSISHLLESANTIQFSELNDMLWASTGYQIKRENQFRDFGKIRNMIIHIAVPPLDLSDMTLRFSFEVLQPMITEFWHEYIVDYCEEYDHEMDQYLSERLERLGLTLLRSVNE